MAGLVALASSSVLLGDSSAFSREEKESGDLEEYDKGYFGTKSACVSRRGSGSKRGENLIELRKMLSERR